MDDGALPEGALWKDRSGNGRHTGLHIYIYILQNQYTYTLCLLLHAEVVYSYRETCGHVVFKNAWSPLLGVAPYWTPSESLATWGTGSATTINSRPTVAVSGLSPGSWLTNNYNSPLSGAAAGFTAVAVWRIVAGGHPFANTGSDTFNLTPTTAPQWREASCVSLPVPSSLVTSASSVPVVVGRPRVIHSSYCRRRKPRRIKYDVARQWACGRPPHHHRRRRCTSSSA